VIHRRLNIVTCCLVGSCVKEGLCALRQLNTQFYPYFPLADRAILGSSFMFAAQFYLVVIFRKLDVDRLIGLLYPFYAVVVHKC
jgi:hypothetical protein